MTKRVNRWLPVDHLPAHLNLPPEAGSGIIELLQTNQPTLAEMTEQEQKCFEEAVRQLWEAVLRFSREQEQNEFDFTTSPLEWRYLEESKWACRYQSVEGRVWLEKSRLLWHACAKQQGIAANSKHFAHLRDAVEWVEKELTEVANQPEAPALLPRIRTEERRHADRIRLTKKLVDGPYWIDPARMERPRITYRILMELEAEPVSFETYESIFGETRRYKERYLSPPKLAYVLKLDLDRFHIEQPAGENSEWYSISGVTTYYQQVSAAEQAQKAWDESQILQQFKAGKISRARYGYQEAETGFTIYLGACENPANPWNQPSTRDDHVQLQALQESLSFALDVTDYRDYLGVSAELISDDRIV